MICSFRLTLPGRSQAPTVLGSILDFEVTREKKSIDF